MPNSAYLQRELLLVEIAQLKEEGYSEEESLNLLFKEAQSQVCVCVCVWARARACVRVCMCVYIGLF